MKKILLTSISLCLLIVLATQSLLAQKTDREILIQGTLTGACPADTIRLYEWSVALPKEVGKAHLQKDKGNLTFAFKLPSNAKGYYYVGFEPTKIRQFIVNNEPSVTLNGNCSDVSTANIVGSSANDQFVAAVQYQQTLFNQFVGVIQQYRFTSGDAAKIAELDKQMATLDGLKRKHLDSLRKANPFLARQAGMNTYYSFQANRKSPTQTEGQYLAENFLANIDFKDPDNFRTPAFFESVKNYAFNLGKQDFTNDQQRALLNGILAKTSNGSPNHQTVLFAIVVGSLNANEGNVAFYGKEYLKLYRKPNDDICAFLDEKLANMPVIVGEEAPLIEDATPDGTKYGLKAMRGKVVLVDFWASWCGPCRRANPHVVELYQKYKDKGFDVIGVSLDQAKDKWVKAIQDDRLEWHHVSDLAGWQSRWARAYGVSAIPHALLLDREGRVIANKINPGDLENQIKKALGL